MIENPFRKYKTKYVLFIIRSILKHKHQTFFDITNVDECIIHTQINLLSTK
jgi:hypothetical protein